MEADSVLNDPVGVGDGPKYFTGLDLGQMADYSALVVAERT